MQKPFHTTVLDSPAVRRIIPAGFPIPQPKTCVCGAHIAETRPETVVCMHGHLWINCACGSTKMWLKGKHDF